MQTSLYTPAKGLAKFGQRGVGVVPAADGVRLGVVKPTLVDI
jgi:hypothetical protein